MTKLTVVSIIPVEFLYKQAAVQFVNNIQREGLICRPEGAVESIIKECSGTDIAFHRIQSDSDHRIYMIRDNSSICLCVQHDIESEEFAEDELIDELKKRNIYHKSIINNDKGSPVSFLNRFFAESSTKKSLYSPKIHYVFSFYVFEQNEDITENKIKMLLEPSLTGLDNMLSSNLQEDTFDFLSLVFTNLELVDIDLLCYSKTYISWATLVTVVEQKYIESTLNLLFSLESRLQIIWNKCYSTGLFIDDIIGNKIQIRDIDELYWNSSSILVEAKSIVSSTLSSRGNAFFDQMIKTSNLEGEIFRLEKKINLLVNL